MAKDTDSFMTWIGGKKCLRDEIVVRFPLNYERYIEVFGGAGWVLFYKRPSSFEVYNDFNSNLFCLYNAVKYHPLELIKELGFYTLNARDDIEVLKRHIFQDEFDKDFLDKELELTKVMLQEPEASEIRKIILEKANNDDIKRAANFYKLIRYSYGAGCKSPACQPIDIRSTFSQIKKASLRLEKVVIENKSFEALIRQYDRPNAFFYCDPPYFLTECTLCRVYDLY